MPVTLPDDLRKELLAEATKLLTSGTPLSTLFPQDVVKAVPLGQPPGTMLLTAVLEAERIHNPGNGFGQLVLALTAAGHQVGGSLESCLAALAASTPGADPYLACRVGGSQRPLVDHGLFRQRLKLALAGSTHSVWVPPPILATGDLLFELISHVANRQPGIEVCISQWFDGMDQSIESIAQEIAVTLPDRPLPPPTTPNAQPQALALWVFERARSSPSQTVALVFRNFRTPETPAPILALIANLVHRSRAVIPGKRIRTVLIGCEFPAELAPMVDAVPRTHPGPIDLLALRAEIRSLLDETGALSADAPDPLIDDLLVGPPTIESLHERLITLLDEVSHV